MFSEAWRGLITFQGRKIGTCTAGRLAEIRWTRGVARFRGTHVRPPHTCRRQCRRAWPVLQCRAVCTSFALMKRGAGRFAASCRVIVSQRKHTGARGPPSAAISRRSYPSTSPWKRRPATPGLQAAGSAWALPLKRPDSGQSLGPPGLPAAHSSRAGARLVERTLAGERWFGGAL